MLHILIHILPNEIDHLENTLIQLKKNSKYINGKEFLVEVILNNNLTDWKQSKLDRDYFKSKLFTLEKFTQSWAQTNFWISNNNEIIGCTDQRRLAARTQNCEAFIWLDVDIIFSDTLLFHMVEGFKAAKVINPYIIITPETTRVWDNTWDIITNKEALKDEASHQNYFNRDPYLTTGLVGEVKVKKIDTFKFGGGWFTFLSAEILNKVPIPNELGPYYLDDTFIMACCINNRNLNFTPSQYVIENEVIIENNKFRYNSYKDYVTNINRKEEFIKIAQDNFNSSVVNFVNNI
jgi:hypothetical protein